MEQKKFATDFNTFLNSLSPNTILGNWHYKDKTNAVFGSPGGAWENTDGFEFVNTSNSNRYILRSIPKDKSYIVLESFQIPGQLYNMDLTKDKIHGNINNSSSLYESYKMTAGLGAVKVDLVKEQFEKIGVTDNKIFTINDNNPDWSGLTEALLKWAELRETIKNNLKLLKNSKDNSIVTDAKNIEKQIVLKSPNELNQILFGPPGTGKTYNTINKAIEIVNPTFDLTQDREIVKEEFERLMRNEQILFTTFHQSMSYEDFIEGIKPDEPKANQSLSYSVQPGIFKRACASAAFFSYKEYLKSQKRTQVYSFDDLYDAFITSIQAQIDNNKSPIYKTLRGRDVEVKEINSNDSIIARAKDSIAKSSAPLTKENLQKLYDKFKSIDDIEDLKQVKETVEITPRITEFYAVFGGLKEFEKTFKPNTTAIKESNEVGIVNADEKQKKFDANVYYNAVKEYGKKAEPVVLIIDEINRGNVSQIFGELITLIEEDKRLGETEALEIILTYSKKNFSVPPNLYIIGTMNTADRSVEALDTALRRRFTFEEMPPVYDLEELQYEYAGVKSCEILQIINKRIEKLLDKDHLIGHSFFIRNNNESEENAIIRAFHKNIIPLLQEYFFGDFGKIGLVIGNGFFEDQSTNNDNIFADFEYDSKDSLEGRQVYKLKNYLKSNDSKGFEEAITILLNKKP